MDEKYFVASPGVLGLRTNVPHFKWSFGIVTPPSDRKAYEECAVRVHVEIQKGVSVDKDQLPGKYHYFGGREGIDEIYYDRRFFFGSRLQISAEGILSDEPTIIANRTYNKFVSHRFMNLHSLGYILTDLVGTLLLRKGYCPIHCSAFRKGDATVVVAAPPNTGKTLTSMMACLEHGADFLAEDLAITDGKVVYSVPWTSTFRYYSQIDRSRLSRWVAALTRYIPLVELIPSRKSQPITEHISEDRILDRSRITHVVVLERGEGGVQSVSPEVALQKVHNLNRYEFNYHKAPLVVAHEFFNPKANIRGCCDQEREVLNTMVTSADHRWVIRTMNPTTYASSIIEAIEQRSERMVA